MRYLLLLGAIVCLLSFQLLGCLEDTDPPTTEVEGVITEASPAEPILLTPESVFDRLSNAFGGRFEGNEDNFWRLREITTSQIYLAYLAAAFPTEEPVQTLEAYFQTVQAAPPDPEKYTDFLQELVGAATEEDTLFTHWFISKDREFNFLLANLSKKLARDPRDKDGFEVPTDAVSLLFTKGVLPVKSPAAEDFKRRHNLADDNNWARRMRDFNEPIMREEAAWLQEQMETHGTDTGLVWGAIYRPALIGEILSNFNSLAGLHAWIGFSTAPEIDIDVEEFIKQL